MACLGSDGGFVNQRIQVFEAISGLRMKQDVAAGTLAADSTDL